MEAALTLSSEVGIKPACEALEVSRAGFYRTQTQRNASLVEPRKRPSPPRALSSDERQGVINLLHTDRFVDKWENVWGQTPKLTLSTTPSNTAWGGQRGYQVDSPILNSLFGY